MAAGGGRMNFQVSAPWWKRFPLAIIGLVLLVPAMLWTHGSSAVIAIGGSAFLEIQALLICLPLRVEVRDDRVVIRAFRPATILFSDFVELTIARGSVIKINHRKGGKVVSRAMPDS